jgi:transketolase
VEILWDIYSKHPNDVVILSNGHAGLALYCTIEHFFGINAESLLLKHGIHPCYDPENKIYCSTGSLGCGLPIAIGYAIAGRSTHCIISDGECAEGSVWESLSFIEEHNIPIEVCVNMNGFAAYKEVNRKQLSEKLMLFYPKIKIYLTSNDPFPNTIGAHYTKMNKEEKVSYEKNIR